MTVNQAQRERWNAEHQVKTWPKRERLTIAVTAALIERLAPQHGERILDVGAGGGLAALDVAKAVGASGSVVGFDLSTGLVALAAQRAAEAHVTNARFVAGDAQTDDIAGAPFDAAMSQFGVMFFADPVAAFVNIRRHLRPGGRLTFACWQPAAKNTWHPGPVLAKYAPQPAAGVALAGGPPPGPFAFGAVDYATGILKSAGFRGVAHELAEREVAVPIDSIFDAETLTPLRLGDELRAQAWADLQAFTAALRGADGLLHLKLASQLFSARNPA